MVNVLLSEAREQSLHKEKKKAMEKEEAKLVTLFFQRTDDLDKDIQIKTTFDESMELVVKRAAKELSLSNSKIGVLVEGKPVNFIDKTVGDLIKKHDAVSYQISSADMLGSWQVREEEEEEGPSRRESDEISTPPTGAGLMRFYDQETRGPKIGGKGVMILASIFLGSVLVAWFFA